MAGYRCPLCDREMERNLILFLDHTEQHIIDRIKEAHPEWVEADGVCKPCAEYYKKELSGEFREANIGPQGRRRRFVMGVVMLALSLGLGLILIAGDGERVWRLLLFAPIFLGMLGVIQARQKTCALLAEFCLRETETGEKKINDLEVANQLKIRGRKILIQSVFWAVVLTVLLFFFP